MDATAAAPKPFSPRSEGRAALVPFIQLTFPPWPTCKRSPMLTASPDALSLLEARRGVAFELAQFVAMEVFDQFRLLGVDIGSLEDLRVDLDPALLLGGGKSGCPTHHDPDERAGSPSGCS